MEGIVFLMHARILQLALAGKASTSNAPANQAELLVQQQFQRQLVLLQQQTNKWPKGRRSMLHIEIATAIHNKKYPHIKRSVKKKEMPLARHVS